MNQQPPRPARAVAEVGGVTDARRAAANCPGSGAPVIFATTLSNVLRTSGTVLTTYVFR